MAVHAAGVDAAHEPSDARADIVAEGYGAEERLAGGVLALGHGEGRGDDGASRMRERRGVRVIGLVGVRQHAVGHGGVDGGGDDVRTDDGSLRDASLGADKVDGGLAGLESRAGDHGRDGVQDVMLRLLQHRGREGPIERRGDIGSEGVERGWLGHRSSSSGRYWSISPPLMWNVWPVT